MSDQKNDNISFDGDDVLSNIEKLKAKYSASYSVTDEETVEISTSEPIDEDISFLEDDEFSISDELDDADESEEQDFIEVQDDEADSDEISLDDFSDDEEFDEAEESEEAEAFEEDSTVIIDETDEAEEAAETQQERGLDLTAFMNYEEEHDVYSYNDDSDFDDESIVLDDYNDVDSNQDSEEDEEEFEADEVFEQETESESNDEDLYSDFYDDEDEDDDLFSDLDDEDDIVRIDAQQPKEDSPFAAALKQAADNSETVKKAKVVKEKKQKQPRQKAPKSGKKSSKLPYIIIAVAVPVLLWLTVFVTDILLVSNWETPLFCAKTHEYSNGSRDYTGAFYQFQIHINDQGEVESVCLPWFIDGPNDSLE